MDWPQVIFFIIHGVQMKIISPCYKRKELHFPIVPETGPETIVFLCYNYSIYHKNFSRHKNGGNAILQEVTLCLDMRIDDIHFLVWVKTTGLICADLQNTKKSFCLENGVAYKTIQNVCFAYTLDSYVDDLRSNLSLKMQTAFGSSKLRQKYKCTDAPY